MRCIYSISINIFQDSDVVVTGVQRGTACAALLTRRVEDFRAMVLDQHLWLDDKVIDHAQALMKVQHPYVGGLYATTSLALLSTAPTPAQGFVQILNVSANHWVTVSNVGCKVGTVHIFDSLGLQKTEDFIAQVTCLLAFPGKSVRLQWPDVQQQAGGSDCGLFAIANSLSLCRGEDPSALQYNQAAMRNHLFTSFQAGILTPFPSFGRCPIATAVQAFEVDIHCLCRRTVRKGKDPLVFCGRCGRPFHESCLDFKNIDVYICPSCTVIFKAC